VYADSSSFGSRSLALLGVSAIAAALVFPIAAAASGIAGVSVAAIALGICLGSGILAFWLIRNLNGPDVVLYQVLLGMMPRMGIALGAAMAIYYRGGWMVEAGLVYYLLVFYFVTLAAETALLISSSAEQPSNTQAS
jgi:hypothetical protein